MTRIDDQAAARPRSYIELADHLRETATIGSVSSLLSWDQETMMAKGAAPFRAKQLAAMANLVHERGTSAELGELIGTAEEDAEVTADETLAASLREIRRDFDRACRLPGPLVREVAETQALSMEAWRDARERSDFAAFQPWLERIISLNRRMAEAYGIPEGGELYDALVEAFEPGMRAAEIDRVFSGLRADLTPLIEEIAASGVRPAAVFSERALGIEAQQAFGRSVLARMGFDLQSGRLDISTHPFCSGIAPGDTRLTSRYREDDFLDGLSSTMHEGGHGLYEQGLPREEFGTPLGEAAGYGIHESQSRLWENMIGRSETFWRWAMPELRSRFGAAVDGIDAEQAFAAANIVRPNLIRVESDEATYNLHIMLRFDLERAMLSGDLPVRDLPSAWNDRIRSDLGLDVPDDRRGCLQDVHWAMGAVGYFPSYTLGNLYSAQFWERIEETVGDTGQMITSGDFLPILQWTREHVHAVGRRYPAPELCERITGRALSHAPLIDYLRGKLAPIYRL